MREIFLSAALVALHAVPFVLAIGVYRSRRNAGARWGLNVAFAWTVALFLYFAGFWGAVGYYFRYVALGVVFIATAAALRRAGRAPYIASRKWSEWVHVAFVGAMALGAGGMTLFAWRGQFPHAPAVELEFPLQHGTYYVGQGGSSRVMNSHRPIAMQKNALDILRLNGFGMAASGILTSDLARHAIFGAPVVSPCNGKIVTAEDRRPDLTPPQTDRSNTKGNHVIVHCTDQKVDVLLAHLKSGSLKVSAGQTVARGDALGRVGNSGNTSQPHLHLEASRNGQGVPMTFKGRFLARNDLVRN